VNASRVRSGAEMANLPLIRTQHLRDPCAGRAGLEEVNGCRSGCSRLSHTYTAEFNSVSAASPVVS